MIHLTSMLPIQEPLLIFTVLIGIMGYAGYITFLLM